MTEEPYLEETRFFLAKALLAEKDVPGAVRALGQTVALAGDREAVEPDGGHEYESVLLGRVHRGRGLALV